MTDSENPNIVTEMERIVPEGVAQEAKRVHKFARPTQPAKTRSVFGSR